ncbi:MAG: DUF5640 domain-containing protein [Peptococcaceae bacterium]|nr:DUF5640 domain-containing protein [Peptococcaceae bacterium]
MRKRQLILACVLIPLCSLIPAACNSNDKEQADAKSLIGEWRREIEPGLSNLTITFSEDGTYEHTYLTSITGSYKTQGNKITLKLPRDKKRVYTYSIEGDILILKDSNGATGSFTKIQ